MKLSSLIETIEEPDRSDVRWAVGKNAQYASGYIRNEMVEPSNVLVQVNIKSLFDNTEPGYRLDINDPTGGRNSVTGRVDKAKSFWGAGGFMNPSLIHVLPNGGVHFEDGRHRLVAAYQLGVRKAPVIMDKQSLENLQKHDSIKHELVESQDADSIDIISDDWDDGTGYYIVKVDGETIGQARLQMVHGGGNPDEFIFQYQDILNIAPKDIGKMQMLHGKNVKEKRFEAKIGPLRFTYDDWVQTGNDDIVTKLFNRWVTEQVLGKTLYER